jgi:hypothetical protein
MRIHDVEKYLHQIIDSLYNDFSCVVHDSYPDAVVGSKIEILNGKLYL